MELGHAFIINIPNSIVEEKFLRLLKERLENYPIVIRDWHAQRGPKYPADWLISSRDGICFTLQEDMERIAEWGLIIRKATGDALEWIIPNQISRYKVKVSGGINAWG